MFRSFTNWIWGVATNPETAAVVEQAAASASSATSAVKPDADPLTFFQTYLKEATNKFQADLKDWEKEKVTLMGSVSEIIVTDNDVDDIKTDPIDKEHMNVAISAFRSILDMFKNTVTKLVQSQKETIYEEEALYKEQMILLRDHLVELNVALKAQEDPASVEAIKVRIHICDHAILLITETIEMLAKVNADIESFVAEHCYAQTAEEVFVFILTNYILKLPIPTIQLVNGASSRNEIDANIKSEEERIRELTENLQGQLLAEHHIVDVNASPAAAAAPDVTTDTTVAPVPDVTTDTTVAPVVAPEPSTIPVPVFATPTVSKAGLFAVSTVQSDSPSADEELAASPTMGQG